MKAMDVRYALFGGSVVGSGWRKCLAEVVCRSVLGGDLCVCVCVCVVAKEFGGSVRRKCSAEKNSEE